MLCSKDAKINCVTASLGIINVAYAASIVWLSSSLVSIETSETLPVACSKYPHRNSLFFMKKFGKTFVQFEKYAFVLVNTVAETIHENSFYWNIFKLRMSEERRAEGIFGNKIETEINKWVAIFAQSIAGMLCGIAIFRKIAVVSPFAFSSIN